jgi:hypothetical protein
VGGFDRNPSAQRVRRVLQLIINMHLAKPSWNLNTNSEHDDDVNLLTHCEEGIEPEDLNDAENIDEPDLPHDDDGIPIAETDLPYDDNIEPIIQIVLPEVEVELLNKPLGHEAILELEKQLTLLETEGFLDEPELSEEEFIAHLDSLDASYPDANQNWADLFAWLRL